MPFECFASSKTTDQQGQKDKDTKDKFVHVLLSVECFTRLFLVFNN